MQEVAYPSTLSPGAVDFIRRALVRAPEARTPMEALLAHDWVRGHMRRAAGPPPHARGRGGVTCEGGAGGCGGAGSSGGGSACGVGGVGPLGAAAGPGSLSLPGGGGGGASGGGSWGGGRPLPLGGAKAALARVAGGALAEAGHNSSCPNLDAQFGASPGDAMDCAGPGGGPPGRSPLGRGGGSMGAADMAAISGCGGGFGAAPGGAH
jgi:hypothetical protein